MSTFYTQQRHGDDPLKLNCLASRASNAERRPHFVSIQAADSIRSIHRVHDVRCLRSDTFIVGHIERFRYLITY